MENQSQRIEFTGRQFSKERGRREGVVEDNEDMDMGREEEWKVGYDFSSLNSFNRETWEQGSSRPRKNLAKTDRRIERMS